MSEDKDKTIKKEDLEKVNGGSLKSIFGIEDTGIDRPVAVVVDNKPEGGDTYLN